jgi:acetyl esterase/lipase
MRFMRFPSRLILSAWCCALALMLLASQGCRMADLRVFRPMPPTLDACPVEQVCGIAYVDGPEADPVHHRLDLFLPKGQKGFPVLVLIHGGIWMWGDKCWYGLYSSVGEFFASQGIGVVLANYRLSPQVKHPEHARDVARALAWTKAHIAEYGGRPDCIFLAGHSAGGHLAALVATDPIYLRDVGMQSQDLRGVIASSGVYRIPTDGASVTLGGNAPNAFWLDQVLPPRSGRTWSWSKLAFVPGIPVQADIYRPVFDPDPHVREQASPITHVRPGLPPFLILTAENELPTLPEMAEEFHAALVQQGCDAQRRCIPHRNHSSVLLRALHVDDPTAQALLAFLRLHSGVPSDGQMLAK